MCSSYLVGGAGANSSAGPAASASGEPSVPGESSVAVAVAEPAAGADDSAAGPAAGASPASPTSPANGDAATRPARTRHAPSARAAQAAKPIEKAEPDELFREGVQAWMRGEARTALALCRRVTHDAPGFGPAWRLMGLVHERLGERTSARNAFEKYLQLSPGAGDAVDIRHRLDAL